MILDVMDDEEEGQTDGFGEEDDDMEFGESQNGTIVSGTIAASKRGSQRSS
tara:strand:- start:1373 stop:1525 length:153 start_codon:yes stop_codon:yes gene_type:complete